MNESDANSTRTNSAFNFSPVRTRKAWCLSALFVWLFNVTHALALTQGIYTYTTNAMGQATITHVSSSCSGAVIIPNAFGGCPVTCIGDEAFANCTGLTSVTISASVTSIGFAAFVNCPRLGDVTIPASVTSIGELAFLACDGLTNINVDSENLCYRSVDGVLFDWIQDVLIRFPSGRAGSYAIPAGVTSVCDNAFANCTGLSAVTIPGSVTIIGRGALSYCTGLSAVTIPDSVTFIGSGAFSYCTGLGAVTIPGSVTSIEEGTFASCTGLASVTMDAGVTSIGARAFENCTGLTSVTIAASVTSIGLQAFRFCTSLTSVTIPASVTSLGNSVFSYCTNLSAVFFRGDASTFSIDYDPFYSSRATIYYLPGSTGWAATFYDHPTLLWNPQVQQDHQFGVHGDRFGFNISGTTNIPVVVEATTNLSSGIWTPLLTNTLGTAGALFFSDLESTSHPARFYRIVWP